MRRQGYSIGTCSVQLSEFSHEHGREHAIVFNSSSNVLSSELEGIYAAMEAVLASNNLRHEHLRFSRLYVSDIINQRVLIQQSTLYGLLSAESCVSIIQQAPLSHSRVTMLARLSTTALVSKSVDRNLLVAQEENATHLWTSNYELPGNLDTSEQTTALFSALEQDLRDRGASVAGHCVRTWFYICDIDHNYKAMVDARNMYFDSINLSPQTHFIASTGIEGKSVPAHRTVAMESYSITNIQPGMVTYLNVPDHMNSTHEYGVAFERGTMVDFTSYRHVLVSGTASIDNRGEILFVNDIRQQLQRSICNIEALLSRAHAGFDDVLYLVVYLRDINDAGVVSTILGETYPGLPLIYVQAPVCRPGWLIEMECEAFVS